MVDYVVQQNGLFKGILWGMVIALPFWLLVATLVILALPPSPKVIVVTTDPSTGIPLHDDGD